MSNWRPSRPKASLILRWRHRLQGVVPLAIWILAVVGTIMLGGALPSGAQFSGIADSASSTVSAPVDGRLTSLLVTLHQEVDAGQVIARLDDSDVRLRLTKATYELERLRADLARRAADIENETSTAATEHGLETSVEQRRLVSAVEAAQLTTLSTRADLEEARIRAQGAEVEVERLSTLYAQEMVGEPDLVRARTERDALRKRIDELENLRAEQEVRVVAASKRLESFAPGGMAALPVDAALAPYRWRLKAQEAELERISLDRKQLILVAPIPGRVHTVTAQAGEWIAAGRSLVSIVDPKPRRILAYVPDTVRAQLAARRPLQVTRGDETSLGTTAIQSISATTVRVPEQLWIDPRREEWAYEVVLAATGLEVPGERVRLVVGP